MGSPTPFIKQVCLTNLGELKSNENGNGNEIKFFNFLTCRLLSVKRIEFSYKQALTILNTLKAPSLFSLSLNKYKQ